MAKLHLATFAKVLKESGKNIRVSKPAVKEFTFVIGEMAKEIASDAEELARHAGRKTITDHDIKIASKRRRRY